MLDRECEYKYNKKILTSANEIKANTEEKGVTKRILATEPDVDRTTFGMVRVKNGHNVCSRSNSNVQIYENITRFPWSSL